MGQAAAPLRSSCGVHCRLGSPGSPRYGAHSLCTKMGQEGRDRSRESLEALPLHIIEARPPIAGSFLGLRPYPTQWPALPLAVVAEGCSPCPSCSGLDGGHDGDCSAAPRPPLSPMLNRGNLPAEEDRVVWRSGKYHWARTPQGRSACSSSIFFWLQVRSVCACTGG